MKIVFTLHLITLFLLLAQNTNAKIIYYVTQNGNGNGTSWATASGNIQSMIDKTKSGDEVWVAKGTYYPTTETSPGEPRTRAFLLKGGIKLYGGFAGKETAITQRSLSDLDSDGKVDPFEFSNTTLLSGDTDGVADVWKKKLKPDFTISWDITGNENNCYHIVQDQHDVYGAYIDGFSVKGGNSEDYGGGISFHELDSYVTNCSISNCTASEHGGGINAPIVINCKVSDCSSLDGAGISSYSEALNSYTASTHSVTNCTVNNCIAYNRGGGIFVSSYFSSTVTNCTVNNCIANIDGGGIYATNTSNSVTPSYLYSSTNSKVTNCSVTNCSGGGIYSDGLSSNVSNCLVSDCSGYGISSLSQPKSYSAVRNCDVSKCSGTGIISNASIISNKISECSGYGIKSSNISSSSYLITNCAISNCMNDGIYCHTYNSFSITNCTINNCSGNGIFISAGYPAICSINNCAISNCTNSGILSNSSPLIAHCEVSNNGSANIVGGTQSSVGSHDIFQTYIKPTSFTGKACTAAEKYELLNANWQLREGSTCINAGISLSGSEGKDLLGNPRVQYGQIDIGAYEYNLLPSLINSVREEKVKCYIHEGILNVENLNNHEKVQIFDIKGVLVSNNNSINSAINFSLPARGVYLVKVISNNGIEAAKVIW